MFRPLITKTIKNTHSHFAHHNKSFKFNNKFDSQFLYIHPSTAINKNNIFKMSLEQYGSNTPFNSNKLSYGQDIAYLSCLENKKTLYYWAEKDSKDINNKYLYNYIKQNLTNGYNNNLQMLDELRPNTQDKLTKQTDTVEQNKQTTNKDNDDQKQSINDNDKDTSYKYTSYKYTPYKYKN